MHLISALADAADMAAVNVNTGHITGGVLPSLLQCSHHRNEEYN